MPDQADRMRQIAELYRRPARPHVITVTSGKGGVGKSTVALNLAITFCDMGKRVILLDADANLGGLDVMLKLSPRTVETHRARIHQKLGLRTRAELVRYALARGLLSG